MTRGRWLAGRLIGWGCGQAAETSGVLARAHGWRPRSGCTYEQSRWSTYDKGRMAQPDVRHHREGRRRTATAAAHHPIQRKKRERKEKNRSCNRDHPEQQEQRNRSKHDDDAGRTGAGLLTMVFLLFPSVGRVRRSIRCGRSKSCSAEEEGKNEMMRSSSVLYSPNGQLEPRCRHRLR